MKAIVFRHVPFEDAGRIAPILEQNSFTLEYPDLFRNPNVTVDWHSADGLIVMGGPMSANDDLPFIRRELGILREALKEDKPVLGVCLGSQLLARAAGARVYKNGVKEIGWAPLRFEPAAATDPLFCGLTAPETVLHWHGETFDLPEGAAWLARTEHCLHQAFRLGKASYGLQFHLEVTPAMVADWCCQDANAGDVAELAGPIDPHYNEGRLKSLAEKVFGAWAKLLAARR